MVENQLTQLDVERHFSISRAKKLLHKVSPIFRRIFAVTLTVGMYGCAPEMGSSPSPANSRVGAGVSLEDLSIILQDMLPTGKAVALPTEAESRRAKNFGISYDDGHGAVRIVVSLQRVPDLNSSELTRCPLISRSPTSRCTRSVNVDGSVLVLNQEYEGVQEVGVQRWSAVATSKDGRQTVISEWNRASEQEDMPSRPNPSLSLKQLEAIATDRRWDFAFSGIEAPSPQPDPSAGLMTKEEILAVVKASLPRRIRTSGEEGDPRGYADLKVRDKQGESLLEIQLQRWKPEDPRMAQLFKDGVVKPNGIRLLIRQGPYGHKGAGAISWTADSLRLNGLRVIVTAHNAAAYGVDAVRKEPALSVGELTDLALNDAWDSQS
ncbi:hypothetical protein [Streptomyces sp. NPDC026673]|uniref:hypothetical protein n=1 Tax=Streptomyces sp. NPDC026673 TaxID=3155724 RepID=UPI0033FE29F0